MSTFGKILDRMDTLKSAGFVGTDSFRPLVMRGPGFKRIALFLLVGFMYKWYRARFINKIPVWDRQPQWNMVITSREQEKDLKAYTCKTCGSTLFIAKNRDWFFEGDTGIGGLGCYTCGAKGKDNFVMDRDRILEDVGEDDDYFDYERPLDFVTAAERRALLKKAQGDEDVANQMLVDQANAASANAPEGAVDAVIEKTAEEIKKEDEAAAQSESGATKPEDVDSSAEVKPKKKKKKKKKKPPVDGTTDAKEGDVSSSSEPKQLDDKPKEKASVDEEKSDISASSEVKQPVEKPKEEKAPADAKESDEPLSSEAAKSDDTPKEKAALKKAPAPPKKAPELPKKVDDDSDVWDDLDALGI